MLDVAAGCKNKAHEARPENDGYQWRAWAAELEGSPRQLGNQTLEGSILFSTGDQSPRT
jgi:hypothetical protein